jgi:hypothetical protein
MARSTRWAGEEVRESDMYSNRPFGRDGTKRLAGYSRSRSAGSKGVWAGERIVGVEYKLRREGVAGLGILVRIE